MRALAEIESDIRELKREMRALGLCGPGTNGEQEMRTEHTGGPWSADSYGLVTGGPNGLTSICETHANKWAMCQATAKSTHNEASDFCGAMHKEAIANARLIASAPELLEALERSLEWLESARSDQPEDFDCSALDDVISQARSVISKAKGDA